MRSPTLLTGLTGTVAVLVLLYVGLTAMNLQPHITFGNPNLRLASVETAPAKTVVPVAPVRPEPPTTPTAPATPAAAPPPGPTPASMASSSTAPEPPSGPDKVADAGDPGRTAAVTTRPAVAPSVTAPVIAADIPETSPPSASPITPAAPPPTSPAAATLPESNSLPPAAASSTTPSPLATPARPVTEAPADAASKSPVAAEPNTAPVVTSAEASTSQPDGAAISERMDVTPQTPPLPLVASVPTPLARPTPPPAEKTDKPAVVAALPLDDKAAQADRAMPQPSSGNTAPPTQSAALTPQPDKPAGGATIAPPNGDLKPIDLNRPFAERAGILTIGGRSLQLAGVVPTDPQRSCTGPNGKEWPCGTLARTALRSFLLGRTITCDVADPAWKGEITAECRFAKLSLGDWLARSGWAEVTSGSPFAAAADEARKAGRGVYGNDPRKKHQSTLAPEPPKDDPLNPI